jgi:hypothetical protein
MRCYLENCLSAELINFENRVLENIVPDRYVKPLNKIIELPKLFTMMF